MAKPAKKVVSVPASSINMELLGKIVAATTAGGFLYVSQQDVEPFVNRMPTLIEVNPAVVDDNGNVGARATPEGIAMVNGTDNKPDAAPIDAGKVVSAFQIMNVTPPPAGKRGGKSAGAAPKYPFDQLEIGQSFFVPVSNDQPTPVKSLQSTVSSANMRYALDTGEKKTVTRAKRGKKNRAVLDAEGNKIMETLQVPVYKHTKKFVIRSIEAGKKYGDWVAPASGALIARVELSDKSDDTEHHEAA